MVRFSLKICVIVAVLGFSIHGFQNLFSPVGGVFRATRQEKWREFSLSVNSKELLSLIIYDTTGGTEASFRTDRGGWMDRGGGRTDSQGSWNSYLDVPQLFMALHSQFFLFSKC